MHRLDRFPLTCCPLCGGERLSYLFAHAGTPIDRCDRCGLVMRNPQPSDDELAAIYTDNYFGGDSGEGSETNRLKRSTAAGYLDEIEARTGRAPRGARLIEIGPGLGNLLIEAVARGYEVTGVEYSASSVHTANARIGATPRRQPPTRPLGQPVDDDPAGRLVRRRGARRRAGAHPRSARGSAACVAPAETGWRAVHGRAEPRQLVGAGDA